MWRSVRSLLPAVRAVTGVFGAFQSGVKIERVILAALQINVRSIRLMRGIYAKKMAIKAAKKVPIADKADHTSLLRLQLIKIGIISPKTKK